MRWHVVWPLLAAAAVVSGHDYYFWICNAAIMQNNAITTTCPPSTDPLDIRGNWPCLCESPDFARTLVHCLQTFAGLAKNPSAVPESYQSLGEVCGRLEISPKYSLGEVERSLELSPIHQTYEDAQRTGRGSFSIPKSYASRSNVETGLDYHFQHWAPHAFGKAMLTLILMVIASQALLNFLSWRFPGVLRAIANTGPGRLIRKHLFLPALAGKSRAAPLVFARRFPLCFPERLHTVLLASYWLVSVALITYRYPARIPNPLVSSRESYLGIYIGYRTGVMAMYNVPLLWLFAGRNNFLIWVTGLQFEVFNHYHRWLARLFTLQILIHACAWTVYAISAAWYSRVWTEAFWWWGILAFSSMCFLCFHGTKYIRSSAYDLFIVLHVSFALLVVLGLSFHLTFVGMCQSQLYLTMGIWAFDRLARLARITFANPFTTHGVLQAHAGDVMELTIRYSKAWKPKAGTYVFIHFLGSHDFWQSHPFTVIQPAKFDEKGQLKLYAKAMRGMTRKVYNRALKSGEPQRIPMWVEGPYGVEFGISEFSEVVLVAGGIGITAIYSHLMEMAPENPAKLFYVHWIIRDEHPLTWFKTELQVMGRLRNVITTLHVSQPRNYGAIVGDSMSHSLVQYKTPLSLPRIDVSRQRPDLSGLIEGHIRNSRGSICFFVCGPGAMSDDVRYACANGLNLTKNYVQFYEESFTM